MSLINRDRISFRKSLSYKQARGCVFIAFLLGVIISVFQIYWNYQEGIKEFDNSINQVFKIVEKSATQAAYSLDKITAYEVIHGLFEYKSMYQATLTDDLGQEIAAVTGGKQSSSYRLITDSIFGSDRIYSIPLNIQPPPADFSQMGKVINVGKLEVILDTYPSGMKFLEQSAVIFFSGLFRNLVLATILILFFHYYLTRPFIRMEKSITNIDIDSPEKTKIFSPKGHENDEFSLLVSATNRLIEIIQVNLTEKIQRAIEAERLRVEFDETKRREGALKEIKTQLEASNQELKITLFNLQRTQKRLIQSEKMAALGEMVASIAHEINTPLGIGVMGSSHFKDEVEKITEKINSDQLTKDYFMDFIETGQEISQLIHKNLEKAYTLIKSFKQVAVDQTSEAKRVFKVKDYLSEVIFNLDPKIREKSYDLSIECDDELELDSYPGAFSQIIINLVMNSINHGFNGNNSGIINIKVSEMNDHIFLEYKDNGKGINPDHVTKIFDPFFTTKRESGGSGLGLHIVYNIVKHRFNGNIEVNSIPQKGIKFNIDFPKYS